MQGPDRAVVYAARELIERPVSSLGGTIREGSERITDKPASYAFAARNFYLRARFMEKAFTIPLFANLKDSEGR